VVHALVAIYDVSMAAAGAWARRPADRREIASARYFTDRGLAMTAGANIAPNKLHPLGAASLVRRPVRHRVRSSA